jgi:hypothetical protein
MTPPINHFSSVGVQQKESFPAGSNRFQDDATKIIKDSGTNYFMVVVIIKRISKSEKKSTKRLD